MRESKERAAGQINHNQLQRHTKSLILIELAAESNSLLHSFRKEKTIVGLRWATRPLLILFSCCLCRTHHRANTNENKTKANQSLQSTQFHQSSILLFCLIDWSWLKGQLSFISSITSLHFFSSIPLSFTSFIGKERE